MGNWTVTTWVRNLFDADYDKRVFFFGNEEPAFTPTRYISRADPLTFGITASAEF
jgi:outer membrane receptor protein involved in Fe transport